MIDGTGADPIEDNPVVVVQGSKILAAGSESSVDIPPNGVTELNFPELTFVPGLIDDHLHLGLPADGRTYEQGFTGEIDFEMIKKVVDKYGKKWIILGNGGLNTREDIKKMIEKTGVDGVGLARGLYGKPWLFKEIKCKSTNNMPIYKLRIIFAAFAYICRFALC